MISSHGPMPGSGASMMDEAGDPIRVLRRQRIADHVADIVGDERRPRDAERIEQPGHVLALGLLVVAALGPRGEAHAAQVGDDDAVVAARSAASGAHMSPVSP